MSTHFGARGRAAPSTQRRARRVAISPSGRQSVFDLSCVCSLLPSEKGWLLVSRGRLSGSGSLPVAAAARSTTPGGTRQCTAPGAPRLDHGERHGGAGEAKPRSGEEGGETDTQGLREACQAAGRGGGRDRGARGRGAFPPHTSHVSCLRDEKHPPRGRSRERDPRPATCVWVVVRGDCCAPCVSLLYLAGGSVRRKPVVVKPARRALTPS